uniref:Uncharacterized protein n=1 Tax=candidate division WOR-3 bacterium TaxID=2052148 RepID=A0A7V3ZV91_UNCW3
MRQRLIALVGILVIILVIFTLLRPKPKSKITTLAKEIKPKTKKETLVVLPQKEISKTKVIQPIKKESLAIEKPVVKEETLKLTIVKPKEVELDTETWGEDPFVREFSYVSEMKSLIVSAITISENEAYAIVNNQIVHVGDIIDGKKVIAIEKDRLIVEKGGKRFTIFLSE